MATSEASRNPEKRVRGLQNPAPAIDFADYQGTYTGIGVYGRQWQITPVFAGWRLEFQDPGDEAATYAGTHATLTHAKTEAGR